MEGAVQTRAARVRVQTERWQDYTLTLALLGPSKIDVADGIMESRQVEFKHFIF
jgi:hypothetical protein